MPSFKCRQAPLYPTVRRVFFFFFFFFVFFLAYRDWKKLTFYYFADSYINFNSLVTDLFKIYKTRIWMSAINPASFMTPPTAGPQPYGQETDRRHQYDGRTYNLSRDGMGTPLSSMRSAYTDLPPPFGQSSRPLDLGIGMFAPSPQPQPDDVFAAPYSSSMYGKYEPEYLVPQLHPGQQDWVNRFQGLSLGS